MIILFCSLSCPLTILFPLILYTAQIAEGISQAFRDIHHSNCLPSSLQNSILFCSYFITVLLLPQAATFNVVSVGSLILLFNNVSVTVSQVQKPGLILTSSAVQLEFAHSACDYMGFSRLFLQYPIMYKLVNHLETVSYRQYRWMVGVLIKTCERMGFRQINGGWGEWN